MRENMIRKFTADDIHLIIDYLKDDRFDCCEFNDFWSESELKPWFKQKNNLCIGFFKCDVLIGFCLTHYAKELSKVYLENIYVSPSYRKKGIATEMLDYILNAYKSVASGKTIRFVALVESNNIAALDTLKKCGFIVGDNMNWVQKNVTFKY